MKKADGLPTVVVVDHDRTNQKLLSIILKEHSEVLLCSNGKEAFQVLKDHYEKIDVIILEWVLPGKSGVELLTEIKKDKRFSSIPAIMVTTQTTKREIVQGIEAGAHYYMKKPFDKKVLLSVLRKAISSRRYLEKEDTQVGHHDLSEILKENHFQFQTVEEADHLAKWISGFCPSTERAFSGLVELMLNAIEHGNLNITYEEKTDFILNNQLEEEINRRLLLPDNKKKYVKVTIIGKRNSLHIRIKDEGKGFDYKKYMEFDEARLFDNHGRGIAMANKMHFDRLEYFGIGNEVEATYFFHPPDDDSQ